MNYDEHVGRIRKSNGMRVNTAVMFNSSSKNVVQIEVTACVELPHMLLTRRGNTFVGWPHPCGVIGGVDDEEDDVDGLHDGPKAVDGGDEEAVGLGEAVVEPQQRVEQREHVRRRLELLRRPAPHDPPEGLAVFIHSGWWPRVLETGR